MHDAPKSSPEARSLREAIVAYRNLRKTEEHTGNKDPRRSFLLNALQDHTLQQWSNETQPTQHRCISLDTNGLYVHVGTRADGIHGHIPYRFINEQLISLLENDGLMSRESCAELRTLTQNTPQNPTTTHNTLRIHALREHPEAVYAHRDIYTPRTVFNEMLSETDLHARLQNVHFLFQLAEYLSTERRAWDPYSRTAWNAVRTSYEGSALSRTFFKDRSARVREPHMYEPIKIISTLLSLTNEDRTAMNIHFVRGHFAKNKDGQVIECLGMYSPLGFHRIFIDPNKHLGYGNGATPARHTYDTLPLFDHKQFATIEAAMMPLNAFLRIVNEIHNPHTTDLPLVVKDSLGNTDPTARVNALRTVRALCTTVVTEIPDTEYQKLREAVHTAEQQIYAGTFSHDKRAALGHAASSVARHYAATLASYSPKTLLAEHLPEPTRHDTITYDDSFLASLPSPISASIAARGIATMFRHGYQTAIISAPNKRAISYAREAQAWRALKLERRPTLVYTSGASFAPSDAAAIERERKFARQLVDLAFRYRANIFTQGTATLGAAILAEEYQKRVRGMSLEERSHGARFVFFEPGENIAYPGNPHVNEKVPPKSVHPAAAIDGMVTCFHGWSLGSADAYGHHLHARQTNILPLTQHLIVPVLSRNGGRWSAVEQHYAAHDNFQLLMHRESGRHAALMAHIHDAGKTRAFATCIHLDAFIDTIRRFVSNTPALINDQDLCDDVFGPRSHAYLPALFELLQTVDEQQVTSVDDATYIAEIERYFKTHEAIIASEER